MAPSLRLSEIPPRAPGRVPNLPEQPIRFQSKQRQDADTALIARTVAVRGGRSGKERPSRRSRRSVARPGEPVARPGAHWQRRARRGYRTRYAAATSAPRVGRRRRSRLNGCRARPLTVLCGLRITLDGRWCAAAWRRSSMRSVMRRWVRFGLSMGLPFKSLWDVSFGVAGCTWSVVVRQRRGSAKRRGR